MNSMLSAEREECSAPSGGGEGGGVGGGALGPVRSSLDDMSGAWYHL